MEKRWALGSAAVVILVTVFLLATNDRVGVEENFNRPMPFLAGWVFTLLAMLLMTVETPVNADRRWWQVWRAYDPLTMVLFGFLFAVGTYLFAVYGGFSKRFQLAPDAFDWARFVLYGACVMGFLIIPRLLYLAWQRANSRQRRRTAVCVGSYCYGMVVVGWIFHEVTAQFAGSLIAIGTATIAGVFVWERHRGWEREVLL